MTMAHAFKATLSSSTLSPFQLRKPQAIMMFSSINFLFILFLALISDYILCSSFVFELSSHNQHYSPSHQRVLFAKKRGKNNKWSKRRQESEESNNTSAGFGNKNNNNNNQSSDSTNKPLQQPTPQSVPVARLTAREVARLNTFQVQQQYDGQASLKQKQQCLEHLLPRQAKQIHEISSDPLLFVIDDFIDPELCEKVDNEANGCFHLYFPEQVSDQLFQKQESEVDGLLFNTASSLQHDDREPYPDGLHVDTNNQCLFRHVTCLLYLNTVPEECGGATVFPIARAQKGDPALNSAQILLEEGISHTKSREVQAFGLEEHARLLESRVGTNFLVDPETETAIKVQPKAGRLLVFFSRDSFGKEDPRSWHAGERILPDSNGNVTEKRILTLFKQVDYSTTSEQDQAATTLENYLRPQVQQQREWLQAKATLQKAIMARLSQESEKGNDADTT